MTPELDAIAAVLHDAAELHHAVWRDTTAGGGWGGECSERVGRARELDGAGTEVGGMRAGSTAFAA